MIQIEKEWAAVIEDRILVREETKEELKQTMSERGIDGPCVEICALPKNPPPSCIL